MRRLLITILALAALCGCERSFDISGQVGDSTIWMTFIPSNDYDSTFFFVQATTPLAGKTDPVLTAGESVEVRVNGQPLTLEKNRRSIADRLQCYVTDHVFKSGDVVEASATVQGVGTVGASCEVPEPFPSYSWKARVVEKTDRINTLLVDIEYDDPGDGGYYGAVVCQYIEETSQWEDNDPETGEKYWGEVTHSTRTGYLPPCAMTEMEGLSAGSESPVTAMPKYYNYLSNASGSQRRVQIWSDMSSPSPKDGRRHMTFASRCNEQPGRTDYTGGTYHGWTEHHYKYQLVLYRFSESYYNYLKARYNSDNDDFSSLGLAPASFVYTNVRGGAGVCGAYTVVYSDWIMI